jgi:tight adherence protein C
MIASTDSPLPVIASLCLSFAVLAAIYWLHEQWKFLQVSNSHVVDQPPRLWQWGRVAIERLIPLVSMALPKGQAEKVRILLVRAGLERQLTPESFVAGWLLVVGVVIFLYSVVVSLVPGSLKVWLVLLVIAGVLLPFTWLRDLTKKRISRLLRALPFFLDLVTLSVEAGLNVSGALAEATDKLPQGPLRDEMNRVLREIRAGRPRAAALQGFSDRVQLVPVSTLVAAMNTAEKQGATLAPILRAQAAQRRAERFSAAEKLAMEAPVKMLLPLVLFIFPSTFAVLLFPILVKLVEEGWFK